VPVRTTLLGRHNVYNCLIAAAVGFGYGMELTAIARGLESIQSVPSRLERIEYGQRFAIFVDHANRPEQLGRALRVWRAATPGRLLCLVPAVAQIARFERIRLGRVAVQLADQAIATHDAATPASARHVALLNDVVLGAKNKPTLLTIADRIEAI